MQSSFVGGIVPAVVTPFDNDKKFNIKSYEKLSERLFDSGVHGIYLCGSTGEGMLQSLEQRKTVVEVAIKNKPKGKSLIVHIGANTTDDTIELAQHATKAGADMISSLPPLIGVYSYADIKIFYETLASACDAPLLVYYFPEVSPAIKTAEQILELAAIKNVIGLKFTEYDLYTMLRLKQSGSTVFYGRDEMLSSGLLMGADGGIGSFYNVIPEMFLQLWEYSRTNKWSEMKSLQEKINEIITITLRYPLFPALKSILKWSGIDCGPCIAPRRERLTEAEESKLRDELKDYI